MPPYKDVKSPTSIIKSIVEDRKKAKLYKEGGSVSACKPAKIIKNGKGKR